jgi:hypothetical protein
MVESSSEGIYVRTSEAVSIVVSDGFAVDIPRQRSYCGLGNALQRVIRSNAATVHVRNPVHAVRVELKGPLTMLVPAGVTGLQWIFQGNAVTVD